MAELGCGGTHALIPYVAFWYGAKWTADFIPKKRIFIKEVLKRQFI